MTSQPYPLSGIPQASCQIQQKSIIWYTAEGNQIKHNYYILQSVVGFCGIED